TSASVYEPPYLFRADGTYPPRPRRRPRQARAPRVPAARADEIGRLVHAGARLRLVGARLLAAGREHARVGQQHRGGVVVADPRIGSERFGGAGRGIAPAPARRAPDLRRAHRAADDVVVAVDAARGE